ncbi:LRRN4 C-terminal-like protein [Gastrophryne carolinensis]
MASECDVDVGVMFGLCAIVTGSSNEKNETATENSSKSDEPSTSTISPITDASLDYNSNQSSAAQPRRITQSQKTTREQIQFITEIIDYDNYEDEDDDSYSKEFTLPPHIPAEACPYDGCKHLEQPCSEIQKSAGGRCLCPGISGRTVPPDPPRLKAITPGQTGIDVNWCSPLSTVNSYRVLYGANEGPLETGPLLNQSHRFFSISSLAPGRTFRICVVAINDAGESQLEQKDGETGWPGQEGILGPCGTFTTPNSNESYIYIAVGVGLSVLVGLLGLLALFYWIRGRRKQRKIRRAIGEVMGVTNMSFRAESVENL